jgi:hypothetical protein
MIEGRSKSMISLAEAKSPSVNFSTSRSIPSVSLETLRRLPPSVMTTRRLSSLASKVFRSGYISPSSAAEDRFGNRQRPLSLGSGNWSSVRASSIFSGWSISAHFRNLLILLFIEMLMIVFLSRALYLEGSIGRECRNHQGDKNGNNDRWNKRDSHCVSADP